MATLLGIDTGGTFTDFLFLAEGEARVLKRPSTPHDPAQVILESLAELGEIVEPNLTLASCRHLLYSARVNDFLRSEVIGEPPLTM